MEASNDKVYAIMVYTRSYDGETDKFLHHEAFDSEEKAKKELNILKNYDSKTDPDTKFKYYIIRLQVS